MQALPTIIGAGPSGLLLGCLLQQQGVACQILERQAETSSLTRALLVHAASLDILDQIGVADELIELGLAQRYIHFHVQDGPSYSLDFQGLQGSGYAGFISLRQPLLEAVLARRFEALGGRLLRGHSLLDLQQSETQISARIAGPAGEYQLHAPWLVGCDGASSRVRQLLGIAFDGSDYPYSYLLAEGEPLQALPTDAAQMLIGPQAVFSVLPLDNGEIRVAGPGLAENLQHSALEPTQLESLFERAQLRALPRLRHYSAIRQYQVRERVADTFGHGRVFLCGDAAHVHSPAGGQAMNLGFGDAFSLAWRLARNEQVAELQAPYTQERRQLAQAVIAQTRLAPLLAQMRSHAVTQTDLTSLMERFSQLYHHLGDEQAALNSRQLSPGARLPNLRLADGSSLWRSPLSEWLDLSQAGAREQAVAAHFGRQARLRIRPDFVIAEVQAERMREPA